MTECHPVTPAFVCLPSFFFSQFIVIRALFLALSTPSSASPPLSPPPHDLSFLPGRPRVTDSAFHSQRPSIRPSSTLPFFSLSSHTSICPSPFFFYLPLKSRRQKKGELVLCVFGLSLCSAKRTQLLNPGSGFGKKGGLGSCKGPYGSPYLFPPFCEKDRGAVILNRRTRLDREGNKMPMLKGADIILFIREQQQRHSYRLSLSNSLSLSQATLELFFFFIPFSPSRGMN